MATSKKSDSMSAADYRKWVQAAIKNHNRAAAPWLARAKWIKKLSTWTSWSTKIALSAAAVAGGLFTLTKVVPMVSGGLGGSSIILGSSGQALTRAPTLAGRLATWLATQTGAKSAEVAVSQTAVWVRSSLFALGTTSLATVTTLWKKSAPPGLKGEDKKIVEDAIKGAFAKRAAKAVYDVARAGAPIIGQEAKKRAAAYKYEKELSYLMQYNPGLWARGIKPGQELRTASMNYLEQKAQADLWKRADAMLLQLQMQGG